jgi:hypothetical protein
VNNRVCENSGLLCVREQREYLRQVLRHHVALTISGSPVKDGHDNLRSGVDAVKIGVSNSGFLHEVIYMARTSVFLIQQGTVYVW